MTGAAASDAAGSDTAGSDAAGRRLVVLDIDDTLYLERDYVRSGFDAVGAWARTELGVDDLGERAWAAFEAGTRRTIFDEALAGAGVEVTPDLVPRLVGIYRAHSPAIEMLADARQWLETTGFHVTVAVVTDGPLASQQAKAEALLLTQWADLVVFTESLGPGRGKPHPAAFEHLERELGLRGGQCAYVADNPAKDFVAPHALGWRTVRVRRPGGLHAGVPSGGDVDAEITSLADLDAALGWPPGGTSPSPDAPRDAARRAVRLADRSRPVAGGVKLWVKVAQLTTVDSSLRYLLYPQLTAVRDRGGDVVGISAPGPYADGLVAEDIRHVPLADSTRSMNPLADLRSAVDLWRILRRERPDVLHTHNPKPGLYGRVVGRLAGVPIVVNTCHGLYFTETDHWLKRTMLLVLEGIAARFSDAELVQSEEDLRRLTRSHAYPRRHTRLLGNGVDLARFRPGLLTPDERAKLRAGELGARDDQIVVGMVGRQVAEKGLLELFEAARRLGDRYLVVVIGPDDPDKPDALDRATVHAAVEHGVRFLGMRDDVDRLYGAMDLFVLPSWREGFPRAAMEASASGLPVVATDVRGCRQVVDDGVTGVLVPVRDGTALARAIESLGDDPDRRRRMGDAAVARAHAEFDEQRVVDIVLDTYRDIARRKRLARVVAALDTPPA
jgi:glycosyltransferase involved in cell wall biosynthesis/FMN phosphatase YigB (HAD superfamily)